MEEWKPAPGYEGLYEVSDQGRVRRTNSSVLLDEDTIVLDALNFAPPCCYTDSDAHAATLAVICRHCGASVLLCDEHLGTFREWMEQFRALAIALGKLPHAECRACGTTRPTLDELVRVESV